MSSYSRADELYLDTGSNETQKRRVAPSFLPWKHLMEATHSGALAQVDAFRDRNAGAEEARLRPVFTPPDHPPAADAGTLAPKRRILGFHVGRDGPPGFDFTGIPEMPLPIAIGYWQEGDRDFLEILDEHLDGFESTDSSSIRRYLASHLAKALSTQPFAPLP